MSKKVENFELKKGEYYTGILINNLPEGKGTLKSKLLTENGTEVENVFEGIFVKGVKVGKGK